MENIGEDHLNFIAVWSMPGFEQYKRAISVPDGEPIVPLSKSQVDELRRKYSHYGIYQ
jgi:hypothetical protein